MLGIEVHSGNIAAAVVTDPDQTLMTSREAPRVCVRSGNSTIPPTAQDRGSFIAVVGGNARNKVILKVPLSSD